MSFGPAKLDVDVSTVNEATLMEALFERLDVSGPFRSGSRSEEADDRIAPGGGDQARQRCSACSQEKLTS